MPVGIAVERTLHAEGGDATPVGVGEVETVLADDLLTIALQPIVDLRWGRVLGYEALSRFPSGNPAEWFELSSKVGLRTELEIAAVGCALEHLQRLPSRAFLAVNVSHAVLPSAELQKLVAGVKPGRVVIELTEHEAIEDYGPLLGPIKALREAGARFAVDDMGAGFSTLEHLVRLAPDIIKLDRALIRDIGEDRAKQALAAALTSFADEVGATVVAEGIETRPELDMLRRLGVRLGQGYLLCAPQAVVPHEPIPRRVSEVGPQRRRRVLALAAAALMGLSLPAGVWVGSSDPPDVTRVQRPSVGTATDTSGSQEHLDGMLLDSSEMVRVVQRRSASAATSPMPTSAPAEGSVSEDPEAPGEPEPEDEPDLPELPFPELPFLNDRGAATPAV